MPLAMYARGPEILAHTQRIGRHFDLYRAALFQTEITGMRWLEVEARWQLTTSRGDVLRARYGVLAGGPLNRPKLPGIPGVDSFKGHSLHTSRWDYAYTGGDSAGGLIGLHDKRGGIIWHRRHRAAVRAAPGRRRQGIVRVPAHAVVGRPAQRPAHRPGLGRVPAARLAA